MMQCGFATLKCCLDTESCRKDASRREHCEFYIETVQGTKSQGSHHVVEITKVDQEP
jgi:hypothetical protein